MTTRVEETPTTVPDGVVVLRGNVLSGRVVSCGGLMCYLREPVHVKGQCFFLLHREVSSRTTMIKTRHASNTGSKIEVQSAI